MTNLLLLLRQDQYNITGESLIKMDDETGEAAHQWVDSVLRKCKYWVNDFESERCGEYHFRGIMHANTNNMINMGINPDLLPTERADA